MKSAQTAHFIGAGAMAALAAFVAIGGITTLISERPETTEVDPEYWPDDGIKAAHDTEINRVHDSENYSAAMRYAFSMCPPDRSRRRLRSCIDEAKAQYQSRRDRADDIEAQRPQVHDPRKPWRLPPYRPQRYKLPPIYKPAFDRRDYHKDLNLRPSDDLAQIYKSLGQDPKPDLSDPLGLGLRRNPAWSSSLRSPLTDPPVARDPSQAIPDLLSPDIKRLIKQQGQRERGGL